MARVRINKRGEIVLTISDYEARMAGDALGESIARHNLGKDGVTATVMRAIDRGLARHKAAGQEGEG